MAVPDNTNRVHVVCTHCTIEAGGAIDTDWKGYVPGQGPGTVATNSGYSGGAGYGGKGGRSYYSRTRGGHAYGSVTAPVGPGSGAGNLGLSGHNLISGSGGGAVRLEVNNTLTLNGTIRANGQDGLVDYHGGGGGSGGAIYITCGTLRGTNGWLSANGGNSSWYNPTYNYYSGAGGGVVWVEARNAVTVSGTISADGGNADSNGGYSCQGAGGSGGSVYITDSFLGAKSCAKGEHDHVPSGQPAEDGTLVWSPLPPIGTLMLTW